MTRDQFIERFRHEFNGFAVDLMICGRTGPELSLRQARVYQMIGEALGKCYDSLQPPKPSPNGTAQPQRKP